MKKLAILAVLGAGIYMVTKKETPKKEVVQVGPQPNASGVKPNSSLRPNTPGAPTSPTTPISPVIPVHSQFSEIPSPSGAKINVEGGTLDLSESPRGYKNHINGSPEIPRIPQFIGSLEGKLFTTVFGELYVVIAGKSFKVFVGSAVDRWGELHPESAIPVRDVPMNFLDKYPTAGFIAGTFKNISYT